MSESLQIVLGLAFVLFAFVVSRFVIAWQLQRASRSIIRDLQSGQARDPLSALDLPYAKPDYLRIGMRDYRRKALEYMINDGVVAKTESGRYYLKFSPPEPS
jgi:hypothetical protein